MYFYYNYKDVGFYESDGREFWNPLLIAEDPAEVLPVNNQNIFYNRNCKREWCEYQRLKIAPRKTDKSHFLFQYIQNQNKRWYIILPYNFVGIITKIIVQKPNQHYPLFILRLSYSLWFWALFFKIVSQIKSFTFYNKLLVPVLNGFVLLRFAGIHYFLG